MQERRTLLIMLNKTSVKNHGIIFGGTTGEYYAQSISERIEILKFAKKIVKDKIPLVAGVGSLRTEDCIFLAKASKDLQYDAILIASPPYSQPTQKENANHALTIDRSVDMPILLYNFPGKTGSEMGKEYLEIVSKSKNFFAIKESSGSRRHPPRPGEVPLVGRDPGRL